jgi:hypothetical protein
MDGVVELLVELIALAAERDWEEEMLEGMLEEEEEDWDMEALLDDEVGKEREDEFVRARG